MTDDKKVTGGQWLVAGGFYQSPITNHLLCDVGLWTLDHEP